MAHVHVYQPDELNPAEIVPKHHLQPSNAALDDPPKLREIFHRDGCLFLQGVLNIDSVTTARRRMLDVLRAQGMVPASGEDNTWTGAGWGDLREESPQFSGIAQAVVQHPENTKVFEHVLGEPFSMMPIVQYRFYPPSYPLALPHQDGYYSPGLNFVGAWIPFVEVDEAMGGLAVALGQHRKGYLHDAKRPSPSPIPKSAIPEEAWHRTDCRPGDVLLIHPMLAHFGIQSRSQRLRLSVDVRLLPASESKHMFDGLVTDVGPRSITLRSETGELLTLRVDEDTNIRCHPQTKLRVPLEQLAEAAPLGRPIAAIHRDGRAVILRYAAKG